MRRILSVCATLAVLAGCGSGGGGTQEPAPNPNPNPNPQPPPVTQLAPTVSAANLSTSKTDRMVGSEITIQGGHAATLYLWYDWSDPNGDIGTAHLQYLTLDRELTADPPDGSAGQTSGTYIITFNVPSTDGGGVTTIDFWTEDLAGHESNRKRVTYTTTQPPPPPPPPVPGSALNMAGQYSVTFASEFGGTIRDRYDVGQVSGTNRISWSAHCDDPGNTINCFNMDNFTGVILDSTDQGATFPFTMGDGLCRGLRGTLEVSGNHIHMTGTLDVTLESFCSSSAAFPSGTLAADRR